MGPRRESYFFSFLAGSGSRGLGRSSSSALGRSSSASGRSSARSGCSTGGSGSAFGARNNGALFDLLGLGRNDRDDRLLGGKTNRHAFGNLDASGLRRVALMHLGDVVLDEARHEVGEATDGERTKDLAEHAAFDDADGLAGAGQGDVDVDRLRQIDVEQVSVDQLARQRMDGVVANERREGFLFTDSNLENDVASKGSLDRGGERLGRQGERAGGIALAVRHCGDPALATKFRILGLARGPGPCVELHEVHGRSLSTKQRACSRK